MKEDLIRKKDEESIQYNVMNLQRAYKDIQSGEIKINRYNKKQNQKSRKINNERKEKLEKSKNTYFDCCKNSLDVENKIIQQKDNKMVVKEDVSRLNDQLGKSIKSVDINEQIYKSEIDKMNKLYIDCEDKYKEIIKKFYIKK